jgi:hypothetical protein
MLAYLDYLLLLGSVKGSLADSPALPPLTPPPRQTAVRLRERCASRVRARRNAALGRQDPGRGLNLASLTETGRLDIQKNRPLLASLGDFLQRLRRHGEGSAQPAIAVASESVS